MAGLNAANLSALDAAARQRQRQSLAGLSAFDRHKRMLQEAEAYYGGRLPSDPSAAPPPGPIKTDLDVLKESYRFIRTEEDDRGGGEWETRLARRYYARLFKEYAIADLSRHREGRVGLRWRTQPEVVAGRGQFSCGARGCEERRGLASFEVPFGYEEAGVKRQALVKVRVCPEHAYQLNYRKNKEAEERQAAEAAAAEGDGERRGKSRRKSRRGDDRQQGDDCSEERGEKKKRRRHSGRDEDGGSARGDDAEKRPAGALAAGDADVDEFEQFCASLLT